MNRKSKGINAERELIHLFWQTGAWSSHRIAGSGSSKYPSPDIIAGNGKRFLALECKTLRKGKKYLKEKEIEQLKQFSERFGAEAWFAMKFNRRPWFFLKLKDLEKTKKGFVVSLELLKKKGIDFSELTQKPKGFKKTNLPKPKKN